MPRDEIVNILADEAVARINTVIEDTDKKVTAVLSVTLSEKLNPRRKNQAMRQIGFILDDANNRINDELLIVIPKSYKKGFVDANKAVAKGTDIISDETREALMRDIQHEILSSTELNAQYSEFPREMLFKGDGDNLTAKLSDTFSENRIDDLKRKLNAWQAGAGDELVKKIDPNSVSFKELRESADEIISKRLSTDSKAVKDLAGELLARKDVSETHVTIVNSLLSDASADFGSGLEGVRKTAGQLLSKTASEQIRLKLAEGILDGKSIRNIQKDLLAEFQNQGLNSFLTKNGRRISLKSYSEMLTRTHVIRTANEATLARGSELGHTIYEMSVHGAEDSACANAESQRFFDTTGKKFPVPPSMPIHPNCRHKLFLRPDLTEI